MTQGLKIVTSEFAVAQFAGSIGQNIITLRDLWVQVKDAPAEVNSLVERVEHLNRILQHLQESQMKQAPGLSRQNDDLQRSLIRCKECIVEFQPLIKDLAAPVQGNSW
jgi:hypothetical protein